ncbi:MAG: hypothetical protein A2509_10815 [Candidatus Edwardsbacteria bacterium RIFOXYD12_FULL_50_11]|uniref:Uncharacterized protein n=1 Tax=Candidatus Edwardsbacteria bacterium GWF2_54_11 TaxID=1817851 RepID=A0A1F5RG21_9BACT|nr:MAG: hypothetical protein A2502_01370 [Candidatus Edwardsbacteria bacterium RifOxyC12_full_54_24]OGF08519.1 MAG: hypothetical protein A2273_06150 [Candidatus Edwardsbacteria bacterium RifOxyA12_full_54_48]OGF11417.1 MAG: hypothetical protein A3K15_03605 [Candidatus Edwardsbacteria bacterium GWE2_54_12]OGF13352.1 MAG: hypothetical protein A2024_00070 [Candidatus Edwardsbacteria bacterium GWF2_54_11]OGF16393.1 MAG: hypothetical protein A2509_10815 [Candidatus Edwardsbacteria bacterium RIFOXYD1
MKNRITYLFLLAALWLLIGAGQARAQQASPADSASGYFQEYFSRLMEEWRLNQVQELAKQWGISAMGTKGIRMNRSFWEERLSLVMWLPRSSRGQSLVLEYQLKKHFLVRGEIDRHSRSDNAWLDFIFRTEY